MRNIVRPECCPRCGKKEERYRKGHCISCYRKYVWKRKEVICKNCKKLKYHKAKGMCALCHLKVYHYDGIKRYNKRFYHNLSLEEYNQLAKECAVCGFTKVVDLHHLDHNRKNNAKTNLVAICPNHHRMLHNHKYSVEIAEILDSKGYKAKVKRL